MSSYSTLAVTRNKAIETVTAMLEQELARLQDNQLSDAELEARLDSYLAPQLNNTRIVKDGEQNDDERVPYPGL